MNNFTNLKEKNKQKNLIYKNSKIKQSQKIIQRNKTQFLETTTTQSHTFFKHLATKLNGFLILSVYSNKKLAGF